jgi:hypothetical protein
VRSAAELYLGSVSPFVAEVGTACAAHVLVVTSARARLADDDGYHLCFTSGRRSPRSRSKRARSEVFAEVRLIVASGGVL